MVLLLLLLLAQGVAGGHGRCLLDGVYSIRGEGKVCGLLTRRRGLLDDPALSVLWLLPLLLSAVVRVGVAVWVYSRCRQGESSRGNA